MAKKVNWIRDVEDLVEFCHWISENIELCDQRCLMSSYDGDPQECTRKICPSRRLRELLSPFGIDG